MLIRKKFILLLCVIFFVIPSQAQFKKNFFLKPTGCVKPTVTVSLEKGTPTYESKTYPELISLCQNQNILGCTLSNYVCAHTIHLNDKGCKQLDFRCYPSNFNVYILSDYPKGTCEYNAIKKHEDLHVRAIQNFPTKFVEDYLKKCIDEEVKKQQIKTGEQIYQKCARKADNWMKRRKDDKNNEIDSYKKYDPLYFSDCKNWKMHDWQIEAHLDMKD